jgi:hypothetical protein
MKKLSTQSSMSLPPQCKIDVRRVRYPVVRDALERLEATLVEEDPTAMIIWWDGLMNLEDYSALFPFQRVSRIPGMDVLCYKNTFFAALSRMKSLFPHFYNFFPLTFHLPFQFNALQREHLRLTSKFGPITWILKPRCGCCGTGIRLVQNCMDVLAASQPSIIQRYISPFLLGGVKFDFRFYILISALRPLTIWLYNQGLARFCSRPYTWPAPGNLDDKFRHLTNTAVNVRNRERSKPILELATAVLARVARDDGRYKRLWSRIKEVSTLSIIAEYQSILQNLSLVAPDSRKAEEAPSEATAPQANLDDVQRYFHILGIDILLNDHCEPIVLELNDRPSMCVTEPMEQDLKTALVYDALNIVTLDGGESPDAKPGGWEKVLPVQDDPEFANATQAMVDRCCQGGVMTVKGLLMRRLGYCPSASYVRSSYRRSLPPLHQ